MSKVLCWFLAMPVCSLLCPCMVPPGLALPVILSTPPRICLAPPQVHQAPPSPDFACFICFSSLFKIVSVMYLALICASVSCQFLCILFQSRFCCMRVKCRFLSPFIGVECCIMMLLFLHFSHCDKNWLFWLFRMSSAGFVLRLHFEINKDVMPFCCYFVAPGPKLKGVKWSLHWFITLFAFIDDILFGFVMIFCSTPASQSICIECQP